MRLIDADVENGKLLDFIAEHDLAIQYAIERKDMTMLEDVILEYFEAQTTAYDIENVVGQLEELTQEECTLHECGIRSEKCKPCIAKKAIEIVMKGKTAQ